MMKYLQSDTGQARVFLYDADDERIMTFDCAFVDGDCAVHAQLTVSLRQACMTAGEMIGSVGCLTTHRRRTTDEARIAPHVARHSE
jgi:hypothetical protein